jgi:CheY-like chemotaxis protein
MGKILFVDDEALILNSIKRSLKGEPFECYFVSDGKKALEFLETTEVDVVFSDMKMPEMNGLELLKIIGERHPDIVKVIISGYSQFPQLVATINQANIFKYIAKPWDLKKELIPIIHESLAFSEYKKEMKKQKESLEQKNKAYLKIFKTYTNKSEIKQQTWELLKVYHQILMKTLKDQIKDDFLAKDEALDAIDMYQRFTDIYLNQVKEMVTTFNGQKIIEDIKTSLDEHDYEISLETIKDSMNEEIYEGRSFHIKPILLGLIESSTNHKQKGLIKVMSKEIKRYKNKVTLAYILEGYKEILPFFKPDLYPFKMYKSLSNIFGGNLEFKMSEDKIVMILTVQLYLPSVDEEKA